MYEHTRQNRGTSLSAPSGISVSSTTTHLFTKIATDGESTRSNHPRDSTSTDCIPADNRDSFGDEHGIEMYLRMKKKRGASHTASLFSLIMMCKTKDDVVGVNEDPLNSRTSSL